jgi:hypothetical protein
LHAALERGRDAQHAHARAPALAEPPTHAVAIGDPQASAETFFAILSRAGLLTPEGWLRPDVRLVSIGDHFDYGSFAIRAEAARSGLSILSWLAAHSPEHVTLIAGNHDLARVAELIGFDDATFDRAAREADTLYRRASASPSDELDFLGRFPEFPTVEMVARDISTFTVAQRDLVVELLKGHRFRLATSERGVLLCHAGAARDDLDRAGVSRSDYDDPDAVARTLNGVFDAAIDAWDGRSPFAIPGLFRAGSAAGGEADGFLYHRPAELGPGARTARRFDPRRLPLGLVQAVGHVRDPKCRSLLGSWVTDSAAEEGTLRRLCTDGTRVSYANGTDASNDGEARMLFIDGGMNYADPERYQLLDLATQRAWSPPH